MPRLQRPLLPLVPRNQPPLARIDSMILMTTKSMPAIRAQTQIDFLRVISHMTDMDPIPTVGLHLGIPNPRVEVLNGIHKGAITRVHGILTLMAPPLAVLTLIMLDHHQYNQDTLEIKLPRPLQWHKRRLFLLLPPPPFRTSLLQLMAPPRVHQLPLVLLLQHQPHRVLM